MKKILIAILIVLLIVLAYFTIFNGITLGNIQILSVGQIIDVNKKLTSDIENTTALLKKAYPVKKEELSKSVTDLLSKKEEYFNIAKVSTEGEITKANTEETYLREYLWVRVGRHATSKGVYLKMDVNSGDTGDQDIKNLAFTVKGQYIAIIQFISALEDDDKLNFKIENFKMSKDTTNITATFNVKNVRIKSESLTTSTTETSKPITTQQNENKGTNQNNTKTDTNEILNDVLPDNQNNIGS